MKNLIRLLYGSSLAALSLAAVSADAARILWVDSVNTTSNSGAGRDPHPSWVELLVTEGGHSVTTFDSATYQWSLADAASKEYVESFDLVFVTRTNEIFNTIRLFGANWKTISTPMIESNPFMVGGQFQSGSWNWLASGAGNTPGSTRVPSAAADASDRIWTGVELLEDDTKAPNLVVGSGNWFGMNGNPLREGISVLASNPANSQHILIAHAAPAALSETSGPRYFIEWGTGNQVSMQYNEDGKKVFLNAIALLTGEFPQDAPFQLKITQNPDTTGTFDFEWPSKPGKLYDLLTSRDLATPIADWAVHEHGETLFDAIPSAGETTTLTAVPSADPNRFFALREYDAPPPEPLFFFDFEADGGGFTVEHTAGTSWAWGKPVSTSPGGMVSGGFDSDHCWGTGIGNPGHYANPTTTRLRSPVLDLSEVAGAELAFHQALDLPTTDSAVVNLISATTDEIIAAAIHTSVDADLNNADWTEVKGISLAAGIGKEIRVEWVLDGTGAGTADYIGWYIDTIRIDETTSP